MTPEAYYHCAILPSYSLLPEKLATLPAAVMLTAIALQESNLEHRRQIRGPARGYLQFELGGLRGVLKHDASQKLAASVVNALDYADAAPDALHAALEHNDTLACAMGRLLLFTHPKPLPTVEADGWAYYQWLWRPGRPHPERWPACWAKAVAAVHGGP